MAFWALFEQAGSSLNFFARDFVTLPDWMNFTVFQSANPVFIILLAPIFAWMWPKLEKWKMNPSIPRKFAFGLLGAGLGFYVLVFAIQNMLSEGGTVPWEMLALCYLIHTMGELCLSPIGLSMVTKLAKPEETGLAMGGWFLSIATALFIAGRIAAIAASGGGGALGRRRVLLSTSSGDQPTLRTDLRPSPGPVSVGRHDLGQIRRG